LLADPDWSRKVRAGVPVRRCIACNSCISGMRRGGPLHCLVDAETGREVDYANRSPPRGKRIAVLGAGPAGLTYASLVGAANDVVVFERALGPGGALRAAGQAPRFQGVEAAKRSLAGYVAGLEAACAFAGVRFRYGVDVAKAPEVLSGFDHLVVATGAAYRPGLGVIATALLSTGMARWPGLRWLFARPRLLDFLYYRARRPTGEAIARLARSGVAVAIIGDAAAAGKTAAAIAGAFDAARGLPVSANLPASALADGPPRGAAH
jgi:threonine dehydrogenase-like Zn-dependent dehydrogenase